MNTTLRTACVVFASLFANLCAGATGTPETSGSERGRECLSSIGSAEMAALMDAWAAALHDQDRAFCLGHAWKHVADEGAIGALMFDLADLAPMARAPRPAEIAPYAHQYAGDMMKAPLLVRVASRHGSSVFIAVNKRPDAPLPRKAREFIEFALGARGQGIASALGFEPLDAQAASREALALQGFVAELDPALPVYRATQTVKGAIRSVGSDGMKSLMERWMLDFRAHQPAVAKGDRWEHLGTLNGFHALMAGETDLAPMGRELWPEEAEAFARVRSGRVPFEIRVARGGFNTQQRTTAQAVFVNVSNPVSQITMQQLARVFGASPAITRWGQLGVTGERADHRIHLLIPPRTTPNAMSMQFMALHGGQWAASVQEGSVAETAKGIGSDPDALGFGGFEDGGPGVKAVPIALPDGRVVAGTAKSVSSGRYPLSRYMYIRMDRARGEPLRPEIKEFLRYVLSRQGQEPILYSGYFPLTAHEVKEELTKLD